MFVRCKMSRDTSERQVGPRVMFFDHRVNLFHVLASAISIGGKRNRFHTLPFPNLMPVHNNQSKIL